LRKDVSKFILMTGNSVLLDTNIISALLLGDATIADNINSTAEAFIPIIVIGELYYGAQYSTHIQKNTNNIHKLLERYSVLKLTKLLPRLTASSKQLYEGKADQFLKMTFG
jgi:predicted nucleic acid-binding protein